MSDLRKMARDAGFNTEFDDYVIDHWKRFEKFARLINAEALAQPEPCADESDCDYMPWCRIRKACQKQARAALAQPEQEPVAVVAMDVSGVHMSYGGQYLGQKPDTKIAMLLKDLPVGTHLYVAVGMGVSND